MTKKVDSSVKLEGVSYPDPVRHTWKEFFMEPVPLTLCLFNIFYALGWMETLKVAFFVTSPFILAFFHSIYEKIRYGTPILNMYRNDVKSE